MAKSKDNSQFEPNVTRAGRPSVAQMRERMANRAKNINPITRYIKVERWHTGSYVLDDVLGGGLPYGVTMLYGKPSSGKSIFANILMSNEIRSGGRAMLIDSEASILGGADWYAKFGITTQNTDVYLPEYGEQALDLVVGALNERYIETAPKWDEETGELTGEFEHRERSIYDIIVIDSVTAMPFMAELKAGAEDVTMAVAARKLTEFIRKADLLARLTRTRIVLVNHLKVKINPGMGQSDESIGGGDALKFHSKIMVRVKPMLRESGKFTLRCTTAKNKTAPDRAEAKITFWLGDPAKGELFGVDRSDELAQLGKKYGAFLNSKGGVYTTSGTYYFGFGEDGNPAPVMRGGQVVNSKASLVDALDEQPELRQAVEEKVRDAMFGYVGAEKDSVDALLDSVDEVGDDGED